MQEADDLSNVVCTKRKYPSLIIWIFYLWIKYQVFSTLWN